MLFQPKPRLAFQRTCKMLRRLIAITLCCLLLAQPAYAWKRFGGGYKQQVSASDIETDTTNFSGNLTSSDTDVQKVIDKFDDFVASGGGYATVQDEGSALTQRTKLNFIGSGVSCVDDAGNTRTNCTITSGGGTGDVVGPASATDNALVRFDSTTGKLIQDSGAILSDANALSGVATLDTGQGANELYDMDQNVLTTSSPTFDSATLVGDLTLNGHDLVMGTTTAGVTLTDDGDGALTIAAKGDGSQENLTANLDDTSNRIVFSTSTGLNEWDFGSDASPMALALGNDGYLYFGVVGQNAAMGWASTNTVDDFHIGVRVGSNSTGGYMSLMEKADLGNANRSPAANTSNPTFRVYSADAGTDNNGYIQLYHDETDGYIDVGSGVVSILDPTSVTGALSSTTTVTAGTNLVAGSTSGDGTLVIHDDDAGGDATVTIQALDALGTSYTLTLPPNDGTSGQVLHTDGSGVLTWDTDDTGAGGGDPVLIDGVAVSDGSGVDLIGGTNGIDITFNAGASPDTATFNLDLSEISAGDLANASVVEDDLAASLAFDDGDFLDLSSINASSTTEGIKLPQNTSCTSATAEGQVCWDTDGDDLYIGDGTTAQQMNGAGGSGAKVIPIHLGEAKITGAYVTATITSVTTATQGAQLDAGDGNWRLLFDASTDEAAVWEVIVPDNYTSTPVIKLIYSMTSGVNDGAGGTEDVEWEGAVMCVTPGDAADIGTASFAAGGASVVTVPGTVGHTGSLVSITPTDDSCAAGDIMYVWVSTDAADAGGNDDATGDRELVGAYVSYT